jgi:hypothetical protein
MRIAGLILVGWTPFDGRIWEIENDKMKDTDRSVREK